MAPPRKYHTAEERRAAKRGYHASPKGQAARRRERVKLANETPELREQRLLRKAEAYARYRGSAKAKLARDRYRARPEVKARLAAATKRNRAARLAKETQPEREARLALRRAANERVKADAQRLAKQKATLKRNYERRKAQGICIGCIQPAVAGLRCKAHWLESFGNNCGLTVRNGGVQTLQELWDRQGGLCAISGEPMLMGGRLPNSASLDHIVPRARGGTSHWTNLQWVTWRVNQAKHTLTTDEFVALCRHVADRYTHTAPVIALHKVK